MADEKMAPLPPPPPPPGGNGGPDKYFADGGKSGRRKGTRRRSRPTDAEDEPSTEDETKEEMGSLAATTSGITVSSTDQNYRNNGTSNGTAQVVQPGAYAVDGPDHGSVSTDANSHANMSAAQSVQSGSAAGSDANQSGNSAVAEVQAALAAEREAARSSGIGRRRPSLRGSVRRSITGGTIVSLRSSISSGVGDAAEPITGSSATENGSGAHGVGVGCAGGIRGTLQGDLANHPAIEFLAEATLVESEGHSKDTEDRSHPTHDPDGDDMTTGDLSTLGPPSELSPLDRNQTRSTSHGSTNSRRSSGGSRQVRGNRQRRPARPTDPFAQVPMATCTSIDESRGSSHHSHSRRSRSRDSIPVVLDEVEEGESDGGAADAMSQPPADVLMAEPLKDKCLLPRRTVVIGVVLGLAVLLGVVLGVVLHPDQVDDTYPASKFNPPDNAVLTTVPEPICYSLLPVMSNISDVCTDPVVDFPQGGHVPQLIANGLLSASDPDANIDIVLFNGGGVRSDIFEGDLTAGFVRNMVMPFINNRVAYLSVTPADIYHTLNAALFDTGFVMTEEKQKRNGESPTVDVTWPYEFTYPYAAGLRFDVDLNAPEGEKATNVRIRASSELTKSLGGGSLASMEEDGSGGEWIALDPTDDATLIRVLSPDFLAGGGDGFFQTVPRERIEIDDSLGVTQLFAYYCSLQSELIGPSEMSTQHFVPLEGYEEGYQPQ